MHHQSYRAALLELERALGDQHAKSLEESLRILLEEHAIEIKMVRSEAQRSIEVNATETHTRLEEVRTCVLCYAYFTLPLNFGTYFLFI